MNATASAPLGSWRDRLADAFEQPAVRVVAAVAGVLVLWILLDRILPQGAPLEIIVQGSLFGATNALMAMGLILIYRTNRIINFANVAMGGLGAAVAINLFLQRGMPYWIVVPIAVLIGAGTGALTELLVVRRFASASRLILTVATIGLAQLLGGIEILGISRLEGSLIQGPYPTPLTDLDWEFGVVLLNGNHLVLVAFVPLVIAGLAWFLLKTDAGVAVRAAAENADRALLLGIPIKRLWTVVWAVAGALSALTIVLNGPILGATPSGAAGPTLLLPALAAAVIARMESLPGAFAAAIALGVINSVALWNTNVASLPSVILLVVILLALLLRRDTLSRAEETGSSTWSDASYVRPIPQALRTFWEVRLAKSLVIAGFLAVLVLVPATFAAQTQLLAAIAVVWGIVAISLVVMTGWGGNISLGQFAIVGTGAVVAGNLMSRWNVDYFLVLIAAALAGAVLAVLIGLPALRITGPFLAVTTLAFAVAFDAFFLNPNQFPELIPQSVNRPVLWERFDLANDLYAYWFCLVFLLLAGLVAHSVRRRRSGRVLVALRDNRRAAEAASIPATWTKLSGFILAGVLAGVAGGLHVMLLNGARQGSYTPAMSIEVFSESVIGGISSVAGAVSGVFFFKGLEAAEQICMPLIGEPCIDMTAQEVRLMITGVGLLIVLYLLPGGFAEAGGRLRDAFLRADAKRRDVMVPSLVADKRIEDDEGHTHAEDESGLLVGALTGEPGDSPGDGPDSRSGDGGATPIAPKSGGRPGQGPS